MTWDIQSGHISSTHKTQGIRDKGNWFALLERTTHQVQNFSTWAPSVALRMSRQYHIHVICFPASGCYRSNCAGGRNTWSFTYRRNERVKERVPLFWNFIQRPCHGKAALWRPSCWKERTFGWRRDWWLEHTVRPHCGGHLVGRKERSDEGGTDDSSIPRWFVLFGIFPSPHEPFLRWTLPVSWNRSNNRLRDRLFPILPCSLVTDFDNTLCPLLGWGLPFCFRRLCALEQLHVSRTVSTKNYRRFSETSWFM
jgi:hypothetical protein